MPPYTAHEYSNPFVLPKNPINSKPNTGRRRGWLHYGLAFMRQAKEGIGQSVCQTGRLPYAIVTISFVTVLVSSTIIL